MAVLTWLGVPAVSGLWSRLGFHADGDRVRIGEVAVEAGVSPLAWGFDELLADASAFGVPTSLVPPPDGEAPAHPNAVDRIDHVVYNVPDLDRAVATIADVLRLEPRLRSRPYGDSGPEMAFFRAGRPVLEVADGAPAPALWGLALRSPDLDVTVAAVRGAGGSIGEPKPAVQGGRIATVRDAGVPLAVLERPPKP